MSGIGVVRAVPVSVFDNTMTVHQVQASWYSTVEKVEDGTIFFTPNESTNSVWSYSGYNFPNYSQEGFEIDMKTSHSIKTVVMRQRDVPYAYQARAIMTVVHGNDSWQDSSPSTEPNTLCINGISEGVFSCSGSGRYLVFVVTTQGYMNFESVSAYTEEQLTLQFYRAENMWVENGFQEDKDPLGVTTTGVHTCSGIKLSQSNEQVEITLQLPNRDNVSSLMFETSADSNILSFDQIKIEDRDEIKLCAASLVRAVGSTSTKIDCAGQKIRKMSFVLNIAAVASGSQVTGLCKVVAFGSAFTCLDTTNAFSIVSPVLNAAAISINLLQTNPLFEILLSHSTIGLGYTVTWSVLELIGATLEPSISGVFSVTGDPKVRMQYAQLDYANRLKYYGAQSIHVQASLIGDCPIDIQQEILFTGTDACRGVATILQPAQTFTVDWTLLQNKQFTLNSIQNSLEVDGSYPLGICGAKNVALVNPPPSFLSFSADPSDSTGSTNIVTYTHSSAAVSQRDIPIQVDYKFSYTEYTTTITPEQMSSFNFLISCSVQSSITTPIASSFRHDLASLDAFSMLLPQVTVGPIECHQLSGFSVIDLATSTTPAFLSIGLTAINLITQNDRSIIGLYNLRISALTDSNALVAPQDFTLELFDSCKTATLVQETSYGSSVIEVTSGSTTPLLLTMDTFNDSVSKSYKLDELCGKISYLLLDANTMNNAPSFFSLLQTEPKTLTVRVDSSSQDALAATYDVKLVAKLTNYYPEVAAAEILIKVVVKEAQQSSDESQEQESWTPPESVQDNQRPPQEAPVIVEDEELIIVAPTKEVEPAQPLKKEKILKEEDKKANEIRDTVADDQLEWPSPVPYISETTVRGELTIKFTERIKQIWPQTDFNALEYQIEPDIWAPAFTIELDPSGDLQDPERIQMSWKVTEITKQQMKIQLTFGESLLVSYREADFLVVTFADPDLFITENGIQIFEKNRELRRKLQRQLPSDAIDVQQVMNDVAEAEKYSVFTVFTINTLLNIGLQQIFDLIAALQFIILLPLLDVSMPANAGRFFDIVHDIAAFDVLEIGEFTEHLLSILPTDPVNQKFESIGLESQYFINNLGSFFLILVGYCFLVLVWLTNSLVASRYPIRLQKALRMLGKCLFWNTLITMVFEQFLIVAICSLVTLKYGFFTQSQGERIQTFTCLAITALYCIFPICIMVAVLRKFAAVGSSRMQNRFGELYRGLKVKNGIKVMAQPVVFLARRLHIALLIVAFDTTFISQVTQVQLMTGLSLITAYVFKTLNYPEQRRQKVFHEAILFITSYLFAVLNIVSVEQNFSIGYVLVIFLISYIALCLIIYIWNTIVQIKFKCRKRYLKKAYTSARRYHQNNLRMHHPRVTERMQRMRQAESTSSRDEVSSIELSSTSSSEEVLSASNSSSGEYESSSQVSSSLASSSSMSQREEQDQSSLASESHEDTQVHNGLSQIILNRPEQQSRVNESLVDSTMLGASIDNTVDDALLEQEDRTDLPVEVPHMASSQKSIFQMEQQILQILGENNNNSQEEQGAGLDEEKRSQKSVLSDSHKSLSLTGMYKQINELLGPSEEAKSFRENTEEQQIQSPEIEMQTMITKSNKIAAAPQQFKPSPSLLQKISKQKKTMQRVSRKPKIVDDYCSD